MKHRQFERYEKQKTKLQDVKFIYDDNAKFKSKRKKRRGSFK